jgi:hypothetical protein
VTFFGSQFEKPADGAFFEVLHALAAWPLIRAPEATTPASMLGAASWVRRGLPVDGTFDYVLGASDADGGLFRGSMARCLPNASCAAGQQFSTGCRESPWDAQCAPCTRCTLGETYASVLCSPIRDAVCITCSPCLPGYVIAIPCGMPGNLGGVHVCKLAAAPGLPPLLDARELLFVSAALGVEVALTLLAVAALAAVAVCRAPPAADPLAAAAHSAWQAARTAWSVLTTAAVVTITLALARAALVSAHQERTILASVSLAALCVGPVALAVVLALPDAWVCAVFRCGPRLQLPGAVFAALRQRPLELAAVQLALPWRPHLLLALGPLETASAAPCAPRGVDWGGPQHAAAAAAASSAAGGESHGAAAASSSPSSVAASVWSPQQASVLRTLTLCVALAGDLTLAVA